MWHYAHHLEECHASSIADTCQCTPYTYTHLQNERKKERKKEVEKKAPKYNKKMMWFGMV